MAVPLLEVEGLTKHFSISRGRLGGQRTVHAVDGVSFAIDEGTTLALVGESGCGKTTTARMILLLEKPTDGSIRFRGADVAEARGPALRTFKRSVQAVFQDPYDSLSPRMRVRDIIAEPLQIHEGLRGKALSMRVAELLNEVGLPASAAPLYPHQFSGGQRQRVAIARAISLNPRLVVLDEPISALDVSIRAQILNLLVDLQERLGLSYLLISHDLGIVAHMSHRIAVMYAGQIVETLTDALHGNAEHPYTQALLSAIPSANPDIAMGTILGGDVANPADPPSGCRFHPRCPLRVELGLPNVCVETTPPLKPLGPDHTCACHFRN